MFETLTRGFRQARNRLAGLTELTESNIDPALREVRLSLLEADVELGVVKGFLARVKEKALGQTVRTRFQGAGGSQQVGAGDQFIRICHDELVAIMEHRGEAVRHARGKPTGIMMIGLQGSGKTTTAAKLARYLAKQGKKPMLVAADMQRPAAVDQLKILGEQVKLPVWNLPGETPVAICAAAPAEAARRQRDVIVYDTAGRLAIDEPLMEELERIRDTVRPDNIYLVVDAMIGQDAVKTARAFHERLGITGVILTKLDGDARGGAAISVREVTGAPILFSGVGEKLEAFEEFRAEGMASRILGMGDVVGLIKDFEEVVDRRKAEEDAVRMLQGQFTFEDFLEQVRMIQKMGSLKDLVDKLPLGGMLPEGLPADVNLDDRELVRIEAMIQSMTREEKADPNALVREPRRVARVARGSGTTEQAVSELVQKFLYMRQMMSGFGQDLGLLGKIPGMRQFASARQMRRAMATGALPGMPGPGGPGGMPGMPGFGMPGLPGIGAAPGAGPAAASMTKMRPLTAAERNAKKAQRKREREARKKGRR